MHADRRPKIKTKYKMCYFIVESDEWEEKTERKKTDFFSKILLYTNKTHSLLKKF